jgi:hypothetical protein
MNFEKLVIIAEGYFLCALFLFLCRSNSLPNAHTHSTATVYHLVLLLAFVIEIGKGDVSSLPLSSFLPKDLIDIYRYISMDDFSVENTN